MDRSNIEDIYELVPLQQGMLFHTVLDPSAAVYFSQFHCVLHGDLDVPSFARAWREVIAQYPALRTSFHWEDLDKPLQVVHREVQLAIDEEDWRGHSREETDPRLQALLAADRERGFDLAEAPLMRCFLIRLDERAHRFVWSSHHLILDGWSMQTVLKEFLSCYDALARGRAPGVRGAPPFGDYVNWLQLQDRGVAEAFWRETLAGFSAPTPLGMGGPPVKGPVTAKEIDTQALRLDPGVTSALRSFAQRRQLTLNTFVQTVWAILLCRYCGERDVVFGSVVSGRPADLPDVESMVGCFINTLPLRARFGGAASAAAWMADFQTRQAETRRFEHSSLLEIRGWSEVVREALFDSILVFQNVPLSDVKDTRFADLRLGEVHFFERTSFPLTLESWVDERLVFRAQYDRRRFDRTAIGRLLGHVGTVIRAISAWPDGRPLEQPLLSSHERHQILEEWNDTVVESADSPSPPGLWVVRFAEQAGRTPEATAAVFADRAICYEELDRRSSALARVLVGNGVRLESVVALLAERNLEFLIAVLAIFKAGGAYLPLDPQQPGARLRLLLEGGGVRCLLVSAGLLPAAREALAEVARDRPRLLALGTALEQEAPQAVRLPRPAQHSLAYVIYTSGSTGRPKGAMVHHRGMLNHLFAKVWDLGLTAEDRVAQTAPQFFDISVWQFLVPLLVGGRVVIFGNELVYDPPRLMERAADEGVSVLELVPSLLRSLLQTYAETAAAERPRLEHLRWLLLTGEALPPELCRQWRDCYPRIPILNAYGPTECSDDVTHYVLREPLPGAERTPIGRPLANTRLYVESPILLPQPLGVPGELCVAGAGVGRGYLGQPARTAEVFVPDPAARRAGGRLYKTGDLVRWMPGGDLEFLERFDHQVKIRGNRIELGEIEAALGRHPSVREAVVESRHDSGEAQLVAYLVPNGATPDTAELRDHLGREVPRYMVPAFFVLLDSIPLTPNGKIDRRALPAPEARSAEIEAAYVVPRTPTEEQVAGIWREVLGVDRVGIHDDFFEFGGHSLSAMRVLSRIHQEFELQLSLDSLFDGPTVAEIGLLITEKQLQEASESESYALLEEIQDLSDEALEELLRDAEQVVTTHDDARSSNR